MKALLLDIRATGDLSWPQWYRCSRTILFPLEALCDRYANSYRLDRGLSAQSCKLALRTSPSLVSCRTNLSLYFRCLSLPFSFSFSFLSLSLSRVQILSAGIQLSAIWSVEAGQRVSPFTLAIIVVACRHCRCDLKDNESDARDKTILVEMVKDREGGGGNGGKPVASRLFASIIVSTNR